MSSCDETGAEPMSTYILEDVCGGIQYHPIINSRDACYKIHDRIKQGQAEWKGALLSMQNMGKGLQNLSKAVVHYILRALPFFG